MGLTQLSAHEEFTFREGTVDVRGWAVRTMADEEKVGEVDDALMDETGTLRYLDVDLGLLQKHVLLPIGQARVDESEDVVWVPGMTEQQFRDIPEYPHDVAAVTREYEDRVAAAYSGVYPDERRYERPEYEGRRPRGEEGAEGEEGRLASLRDLEGFDVADEEPDPRGWEVIAADERVIGKVEDLVVDTAAMKVRYLDCDVDEEALGLGREDWHILIPIGYARLDEPNEKVILKEISSTDVRQLPVFGGRPVTREYEEELRVGFTGGLRGENYYRHPRFDEARFYAPRRGRGAMDVHERGD